jgi:hypothetical protein
MKLPDNFYFNQGNLQDFTVCPRRFQLKHIQKLVWPGIVNEPVMEYEIRMQQGSQFHQLIQHTMQGVPQEIIAMMASETGLENWWQRFLSYFKENIESSPQKFSEISLYSSLAEWRIIARYDLILVKPGEVVVFDWKTSLKHPSRTTLASRMQTHVYPFLIAKVGSGLLPGLVIDPECIKMVYWFVEDPDRPEKFIYSNEAYQQDTRFLKELINEIINKPDDQFEKTTNKINCRFCVYRSLCDRGISAGHLNDINLVESSEGDDVLFDFQSVPELEI